METYRIINLGMKQEIIVEHLVANPYKQDVTILTVSSPSITPMYIRKFEEG